MLSYYHKLQPMLRVSIAQPCHEKWDEMTPVERGAYCRSCCKEVVDFTTMSDKELFIYFKNKRSATCGRFRDDQLNRSIPGISPDVLTMDIPLWKKFIAVLFICFSSFIIGCNNKKDHSKALEVELPLQVQPQTSINTISPSSITKEAVLYQKKENTATKFDCSTYTLGFVTTDYIEMEPRFDLRPIRK